MSASPPEADMSGRGVSLIHRKDALRNPSKSSPPSAAFPHRRNRARFLSAEATMSHVRPMHHQQLPTVGSVAWLIIAVMFIILVVLSGALALLGLLLM